MKEKEKAAKGLLYDANFDEQLADERIKCKTLCYEHNKLEPSRLDERKSLIKKIVLKIGNDFHIEHPFWCDYGYNIEIGENFYSNHNLIILDAAKVSFGENVFIGPNCGFYTAGHPIDIETRNKGLEYAYPIKIGNNVWFGGNVVVLPGVDIGDGCVIGAGSIVNKSIPSNTIAAGNPCRIIREITDEDKKKYRNY